MKLLIPLAGALALIAVCAKAVPAAPPVAQSSTSSEPTNPAIKAKKAEAAQVLNEIAVIDEQLNATSEQYDGARVRLQALRRNLKTEEAQLAGAKARYARAQERAAKFLVWLYTSNHSSSLDVILGARSLGELLQLSDAENVIGRQATMITNQTAAAKAALEVKVHQLARDRSAAASTVRELADQRTAIMQGLEQRRKLLASVQSEVTKLEAAERARQARLAAEARARVAAEIAARARAQAAAAAAARRAAAAQAAQVAAQARAAAAATTSPTPTDTAAPTATPTPAAGTPAPPPITTASGPFIAPSPVIPTADLPAGHPEAAQIALQYLGIPYLWGGSIPATGFDCSGLVTYVFAQLGVLLPHFAAAQWEFGVPVTVAQLQPGDLVFFDALDHVGIYLGNNQFINAPHTGSWVRIDTLDEPWYAKHYVGARRV